MSEHDQHLRDAGTLLNAVDAQVDLHRLVTYSLDPTHPHGRHKAYVFAKVMGYDQRNAEELAAVIMAGVKVGLAQPGPVDHRGMQFRVDMDVRGPNGRRAIVCTNWIFDPGTRVPHLTSAFVRRGGTRA